MLSVLAVTVAVLVVLMTFGTTPHCRRPAFSVTMPLLSGAIVSAVAQVAAVFLAILMLWKHD